MPKENKRGKKTANKIPIDVLMDSLEKHNYQGGVKTIDHKIYFLITGQSLVRILNDCGVKVIYPKEQTNAKTLNNL